MSRSYLFFVTPSRSRICMWTKSGWRHSNLAQMVRPLDGSSRWLHDLSLPRRLCLILSWQSFPRHKKPRPSGWKLPALVCFPTRPLLNVRRDSSSSWHNALYRVILDMCSYKVCFRESLMLSGLAMTMQQIVSSWWWSLTHLGLLLREWPHMTPSM